MGAPPSSFDFFQRSEQVVPSTVAWRPSGAAGLSRTFTSALAESEPDALLTVNTNLPANFFVTLSIDTRHSNYGAFSISQFLCITGKYYITLGMGVDNMAENPKSK